MSFPAAPVLPRAKIVKAERSHKLSGIFMTSRSTAYRRGIALIMIGLVLTVAAVSVAANPRRGLGLGAHFALVIGNNDYRHMTPLRTAVNDATAVANTLEAHYNFHVTTLVNATKKDIIKALNRFRRGLTEEDSLLVYYAGHGTMEAGGDTGYWLPVDAEDGDDFNWIANAELTRRFKSMPARHVLVVADSCYSGSLLRAAAVAAPAGGKARRQWLHRQATRRSRVAMTSGGLEPVVDAAGRQDHSVFADSLLAALSKNKTVLSASELFDRVVSPVVTAVDQTPDFGTLQRAGHEGGDFVFVPRHELAATRPQLHAETETDITADTRGLQDLEYWKSVKNSSEAIDFKMYLAEFPDGAFAALAKLHLQRLQDQPGHRHTPALYKIHAGKVADTATPVGLLYRTTRDVNLHRGPGKAAKIVGVRTKGADVIVTGQILAGQWLRVQLPGGADAYVSADAVVPALPHRSPLPPPTTVDGYETQPGR